MNISAKTVDVRVHGNFIDGRELEAGKGEMLTACCLIAVLAATKARGS